MPAKNDLVTLPKKTKRTEKQQPGPNSVRKAYWMSIEVAADRLGLSSPEALRKKLDRNVFKASDGVIESYIDGVRARKFGRSWRVLLSQQWEFEAG